MGQLMPKSQATAVTLRSFSFSLGMFEAFLLTFMNSLYLTHDNSEAVTHSLLSPCSSPYFSSLNVPCYFWTGFKYK